MKNINQSFNILQDVIELQRAGRRNAAKATWDTLEVNFRERVLQLVLNLYRKGIPNKLCPTAITSPYGDFTLALEQVDDQTIVIPDLIKVLQEVIK